MAKFSKEQLLKEYKKRKAHSKKDFKRMRDPDFLKQNEVLDSRANRFKGINCTRRSGKSVGEAIDHMEICEEFPKSVNLYLGLTIGSVSNIIWDVFKDLNEIGKYGCVFNETRKTITFPNRSKILLGGLDVSEKQMRKLLGQKLRKVSIDEAGSITQDMKKICYQMIQPALADLRPNSWLSLLGTCENIPNTFFEQVVEGKERGANWKIFKWTAYENPHMVKQWTDEINEMVANNPLIVEASWFKTHYLNQWCSDDNLLIIKYDQTRNRIYDMINEPVHYVLGVDLGYNDASSFSVVAFSYDYDKCWIVKTTKETQLDFTGVAEQIKLLMKKYPFFKIIVDGANKQGVEEIKKRHGIPMESAEKSDKATYLRLLRDDLLEGKVLLLDGECNELITEWAALQWKDDSKEKEDDRCQNHLSDATLYAWRFCSHYTYRPPAPPEDKDSNEYMDKQEARECEEMRREEEEGKEWWEGQQAA